MAEDAPNQADNTARIAELKGLTFGLQGLPLLAFVGLTDDQIQEFDGIGPKFCNRIRAALAELEQLDPTALVATETPASSADEYVEPFTPTPEPTPEPEPEPLPTEPVEPSGERAPDISPEPTPRAPQPSAPLSGARPPESESSGEKPNQDKPGKAAKPAKPEKDDADNSRMPTLLLTVVVAAILIGVILYVLRPNGAQMAAVQAQNTSLNQKLTVVQSEAAAAAQAQARQVYACAQAANLGQALDALQNVKQNLSLLEKAAADASANDAKAKLAVGKLKAAEKSLADASEKLNLTQPTTLEDIKTACEGLCKATADLSGRSESTDGTNAQTER